MADENLVNFIRNARQQGQAEDTIKQTLMVNGWQEALIDEAILAVSNLAASPMQTSTIPSGQVKNLHVKKPMINSPFSVLLAVVLAVSLFILTNKVISDIAEYFELNTTASLIISGLIVLPFLLLAFGLHFSLGEKNKKYLILSRPYYIISAWLLIRLLYDVSKYLLDQKTTYGVYIVLILIIVVLTGMILFVQKYLRK